MLTVSVLAPAGSQPVELGGLFVGVLCIGMDGRVLDVSHGVTVGGLSSCCRAVACVSAASVAFVSVPSGCAIDGDYGLLAISVSISASLMPLMCING